MLSEEHARRFQDLIYTWMKHFSYRSDFQKRLGKRVHQEEYQQERIEQISQVVDLNHKKILDAGCGMGGLVVALLLKGYEVSGLDFNSDYCEITRLRAEKYNLNPSIICAPLEKIPLANNSFDVIYCNDVIEHVQDPLQSLRELYRILNPGGIVYITLVNRFGYRDPHYHVRYINWLPRKIGDYLLQRFSKKDVSRFPDRQRLGEMHYFSRSQAQDICFKAGFKISSNVTEKQFQNKYLSTKSPIKKFLLQNSLMQHFLLYWYVPAWTVILSKEK